MRSERPLDSHLPALISPLERTLFMEQHIQHKPRVSMHPELSTAASLLAHDVPNFVREGVHLAKLEAQQTVKDVGVRAGILAVAGYLAAIGLFLACVGLSVLVSEALERAWAGPLVVGGGLCVLGAITVPIALKTRRVKPVGLHD